jgi:DNA-binding NarL/FixJ family response regulator
MKYSIIHADRDFRYHQKLKASLDIHPEFYFKDHCCYLDAVLQLLNNEEPSVILTASKLYDEPHAMEALCNYRDEHLPCLKIVVLTSKEDPDHFINSLLAGVDGYLSKSSSTQQIAECLRTIMDGDTYFGIHKLVVKHK